MFVSGCEKVMKSEFLAPSFVFLTQTVAAVATTLTFHI
jgi:hypothetical protein